LYYFFLFSKNRRIAPAVFLFVKAAGNAPAVSASDYEAS